MIKYSMPRKATTKERSLIYTTSLLASSTYHLSEDDLVDLDERTYFFTIHVASNTNIPKFLSVLYTMFRKSLSFKDDPKLAMIAAADVKGTKTRSDEVRKKILPHIHGLLILPKHLHPCNSFQEHKMIMNMRRVIMLLNEVDEVSRRRQVEKVFSIERLRSDDKSIFDTIDYIIKADKNYLDVLGDTYAPRVFPFEHDLRKIEKSSELQYNLDLHKIRMHIDRSRFFKNERNTKMYPFQLDMKRAFDEATTSEERANAVRRICQIIL